MELSILQPVRLKSLKANVTLKATALAAFSLIYAMPANAQTAAQSAVPSSSVMGSFNNVIQVPNQNNAQNSNTNSPVYNNISPLNAPANDENDLSFGLSAGFSNDVTVTAGVVFQPGRSRAHDARMKQIAAQTELLTTQNEIAEAQLQLIQLQVQEAEQRSQTM